MYSQCGPRLLSDLKSSKKKLQLKLILNVTGSECKDPRTILYAHSLFTH